MPMAQEMILEDLKNTRKYLIPKQPLLKKLLICRLISGVTVMQLNILTSLSNIPFRHGIKRVPCPMDPSAMIASHPSSSKPSHKKNVTNVTTWTCHLAQHDVLKIEGKILEEGGNDSIAQNVKRKKT